MRAGRPIVVLAFVTVLFVSGCLAPRVATVPPGGSSTAHAALVSYDGDGKPRATPAELAGGFDYKEILLGNRGGEPNIGVTSNGWVFTDANMNTMRSKDHGATWQIVFNLSTALPQNCSPAPPPPAPVGCPVTGYTRSSDPMLWVDTTTDRVFTVHMTSIVCANFITSDDKGDSWLMKPMTCGLPGNDHEKVMTSPFSSAVPTPPDAVYPDVTYYCYNRATPFVPGGTDPTDKIGEPGITDCAVSLDGGRSFAYDRIVSSVDQDGCGGINGHPAAAKDGTVYVPMDQAVTKGCAGPVVGVTEDNGLTWTVRHGPTMHGAEEIDPDITVTPDGTAYILWRGSDHLQYLARSHDKFATWQGPWRVSPPDVTSTVYTVIDSAADGRLAMAYLGTRDSANEPSKTPNATRWNMFVTYSLDAASDSPTFTTKQVTPDSDPVQIGCVWMYGGSSKCRNLLDFIDMSHDAKDGRVYISFTDGCTKLCAGNASATANQSRQRDGAVMVQVGGPTLLPGVALTPSAGVAPVSDPRSSLLAVAGLR
ncbi:MAG: sialidase family protein [Thermoplasmatota archaeon]